jgi:glycosyltransferase involved in cell wall biosynthesis
MPTVPASEHLDVLHGVRILHGAADLAWQASILAHQLREEGYRSYSLAYSAVPWGEQPDVLVDTMAVHGWRRALRQLHGMLGALPQFDLFHVHGGKSLLYDNLDIPLLAAVGKKFVFHFHGSELRPLAVERRICEWTFEEKPSPNRRTLWRRAWRLAMARRYGALILVSTPDLLRDAPEAQHLPVALRLDQWEASPRPTRHRVLRVAHAPTATRVKGTKYIQSAVERLRDEGLPIELDVLTGVPRHRLLERLRLADVFVDQVRLGWYGLAAVEALALGIPTVCYIRDDLANHMAPLPFIQADSASIERVLRYLYHERDALAAYVDYGRHWVEHWHDAKAVTRRLLSLYAKVLAS